jgi:hypothetical protein
MADPNEMLRRVRHDVALLQDAFSGGPGSYDRERIAEDVVASFDVLDAFLSSGGKPPTAWVEGPDEPSMDGDHWGWQSDKPAPEGFAVFAHWSQVHDGVNVEMDVPDGLRVTVHYNEWLAVDAVAGQGGNDGTPLPTSAEIEAQRANERIQADRLVRSHAPAVLSALDVRVSRTPERIAEIAAGLEVVDVLRVLPALELSGQAVWTGTGWKLAEGARITRLVTP